MKENLGLERILTQRTMEMNITIYLNVTISQMKDENLKITQFKG